MSISQPHTTPSQTMPSHTMLSERQAVKVLAARAITPRHARHVLQAGLAGPPTRTASTIGYDADRVRALLERTAVPMSERRATCPHGLMIGRRFLSVLEPRPAQLEAVSPGWRMSLWTLGWFERRIDNYGPMPVVFTIAGFVTLGADLTALRPDGGRVSLVLGDAGSWFAAFDGHRFSTWSGNAWQLAGLHWRDRPRGPEDPLAPPPEPW